jgi:peptide/nickel transport system substrate-binding protein
MKYPRVLFGILLVVVLLASGVSAQDAVPTSFSEAPMLAELVASGALPPVEERLPVPEDIMVVPVVERIGEYGGTWRTVAAQSSFADIRMNLYDPPIRWASDYSAYVPGLAKSWSYNEDGSQLTINFRRGVRWSDGAPFTTDDLRFWWEDMAQNPDYRVSNVPWWFRNADGSPILVEFPDEHTMVLNWDRANWIAYSIFAQGYWEWEAMMFPRHYLEQFHPTYTEGATYEDLEAHARWWINPDFPTMHAWHLVSYTPGERWSLERNPYYWKTDAEGNQLPYIDRLDVELVADPQVRVLNMSQGRYDAAFRGSQSSVDIPFLLENAEANNYRVMTGWMQGNGAEPNWMVNQSYDGNGEDPAIVAEIRALLRDRNFRQGVSHAIDRQRIVDVVWEGFAEPKQMTASPQSMHFASPEGQALYQEWAQAHTSYDVDLANELLDAAGMTGRDSEGYRTLPSGARFELVVDVWDYGLIAITSEASELLRQNLEAVGVRTIVRTLADVNQWIQTLENSSYMFSAVGAAEMDLYTYPDWLFPVRGQRAWPRVGQWYSSGGERGEPPIPGSPEEQLIGFYEQGLAESDFARRQEIMLDAFRVHIEEGPFNIGAGGDTPLPVVVANNFRNVPENGVLGPWAPGSPGNMFPEQFFFDN